MKTSDALRELADVTSSQWGMVTTAQAGVLGVSRLDLSRLAEGGHLERLTHGVYKDAGAPGSEFDELRAAWLSTEPKRFAGERVSDAASGVVVASTSAAFLHSVGDIWADRHQFVSPIRRQSQRDEIRFRRRTLANEDVTVVHGLPVMRIERTLADLLEDLGEQSLVADALRDAVKRQSVDMGRLGELLDPLAERNGFRKNEGVALLSSLVEIAGLDLGSVAKRIMADPVLGARVATDYLKTLMPAGDSSMFQSAMAHMQLPAPAVSIMTPELSAVIQRAMQPQLDELAKLVAPRMPFVYTPSLLNSVNAQAFKNLSKQWAEHASSLPPTSRQEGLVARTDREGEGRGD